MTATRTSPLPLADLLAQPDVDPRTRYRLKQRLSTYTRSRTVALGPHLRVIFEDEWTRHLCKLSGRWSRSDAGPAATPLPGALTAGPGHHVLAATVQIELGTPQVRSQWLAVLIDAAQHICLEVRRSTRLPADVLAPCHLYRMPGLAAEQPLRFDVPLECWRALRDNRQATLALACTHTRYSWRHVIPPATVASLLASADDNAR